LPENLFSTVTLQIAVAYIRYISNEGASENPQFYSLGLGKSHPERTVFPLYFIPWQQSGIAVMPVYKKFVL
jgi:hypothetical protein